MFKLLIRSLQGLLKTKFHPHSKHSLLPTNRIEKGTLSSENYYSFKVNEYTPTFFCHFAEGDNFCDFFIASFDDIDFT